MKIQSPIPFVKMHGSGNDFVVIRSEDFSMPASDLPEFTRLVCRRGTSIGADGVIIISPSNSADFHWRYINADGSDGDMCGNGAMVGARYAVENEIAGANLAFDTASGIIRAMVDGTSISLDMVDAEWKADGLSFPALPGVEFDHLVIGVPHVVGQVENVDEITNLDDVGRTIRHDAQLHPAGANVNLIHTIDEHTIRMRTYERGVEAETLACGTGAVCSAITAEKRGLVQQPVSVKVSSGMYLRVSWQSADNRFTDIRLSGTARIVARGEITAEALQ